MKKLVWESDFFGYPVYSCSEGTHSIPNDAGLIIERTKNVSSTSIPNFHKSFTEIKLLFTKIVDSNPKKAAINLTTQTAQIDQIKPCYFLALIAGQKSRFNLDKEFKRSEFAKLYFEWIFKSLQGQFDDEVILFYKDAEVCGLVTLKHREGRTTIGLISVEPIFQNQNIGKAIIDFVIQRATEKKSSYIDVSTQDTNIQAVAFYKNCGFEIRETEVISHFWKNKANA